MSMALINVVAACTTVTEGTAGPDTKMAPAYRSSVSASASASAATSSVRESQRQQSLTTKAILSSCETLATSSNTAIDKVNEFVSTYNQGGNTGPSEAPAIAALNDSATTATGAINDAMPSELRDAFNAYSDAARAVANAIGGHASTGEFNNRVNQLNDSKTKALKLCRGSF
jgi:ABC-type transporter Mla subunit MlaD